MADLKYKGGCRYRCKSCGQIGRGGPGTVGGPTPGGCYSCDLDSSAIEIMPEDAARVAGKGVA